MGLAYDADLRYLTSIGEDGYLRVTDLSTKELQHEELLNPIGLKYMIDDP